jgi:large subunit ribosomal protein L18
MKMGKKNIKKTNIKGNTERLRVSVFRSNENIFAQLIDDESQSTVVSASSLKIQKGTKTEKAKHVGQELAEKAKQKKIKTVVFDRGRYVYKGRIKELADSAREHGLVF